MPYITPIRKTALKNGDKMKSVGELVYILTLWCIEFARIKGRSFTTFALIIGALVCAALEYYRRVVAKHENCKIKENGDVYPEEYQ